MSGLPNMSAKISQSLRSLKEGVEAVSSGSSAGPSLKLTPPLKFSNSFYIYRNTSLLSQLIALFPETSEIPVS